MVLKKWLLWQLLSISISNFMKDVTSEQIIEALEANYGIISSTLTYLYQTFGINIGRTALKNKIDLWGMHDFLRECRVKGVEKCLAKRMSMAIDNGSEAAIGWMLATYGHHAEFLEIKEDNKLEMNKGDIAQYYERMRIDHISSDTEAIAQTD